LDDPTMARSPPVGIGEEADSVRELRSAAALSQALSELADAPARAGSK
jgi:hypothetical protein